MLDVVFVHGIRGGAFATWRREGVQNVQPGHKPGNLDHPYCWPSTWLPQDVPEARLLSMEYAAPASGWEVSMRCYVLHTRIKQACISFARLSFRTAHCNMLFSPVSMYCRVATL